MTMKKITPLFKLSGSILIFFFGIALLAPWIAPYDPNAVNRAEILAPMSSVHLLGTDTLGRDVFSRVVYGARISVFYAMTGAACTMVLGAFLGIVSGYFGGAIDRVIQSGVHIFQGLPGMSLMIAIAGVLGPGTSSILIAVTLTSWTSFSRLVRAEVLQVRDANYVTAARALGAGHGYILRKYILPNILPSMIVLWSVRIGSVLLSVASLSFLGLGVQPPQADWGIMIFDAKSYFRTYPWLLWGPGICITVLSIAIQVWGDELRDCFLLTREQWRDN